MNMKSLAMRLVSVALLALVCVLVQPVRARAGQSTGSDVAGQSAQTITITRSDAIPTAPGPADHFTGAVKLDTLTDSKTGPGRTRILNVTFAPGAYTAWHSHPHGQLLIVTAGSGYVQQWGGKIQAIHAGDTIWTPPNVKHWHGAGLKEPMSHLSIYEEPDAQVTKWMEKVTDEEYRQAK